MVGYTGIVEDNFPSSKENRKTGRAPSEIFLLSKQCHLGLLPKRKANVRERCPVSLVTGMKIEEGHLPVDALKLLFHCYFPDWQFNRAGIYL